MVGESDETQENRAVQITQANRQEGENHEICEKREKDLSFVCFVRFVVLNKILRRGFWWPGRTLPALATARRWLCRLVNQAGSLSH